MKNILPSENEWEIIRRRKKKTKILYYMKCFIKWRECRSDDTAQHIRTLMNWWLNDAKEDSNMNTYQHIYIILYDYNFILLYFSISLLEMFFLSNQQNQRGKYLSHAQLLYEKLFAAVAVLLMIIKYCEREMTLSNAQCMKIEREKNFAILFNIKIYFSFRFHRNK